MKLVAMKPSGDEPKMFIFHFRISKNGKLKHPPFTGPLNNNGGITVVAKEDDSRTRLHWFFSRCRSNEAYVRRNGVKYALYTYDGETPKPVTIETPNFNISSIKTIANLWANSIFLKKPIDITKIPVSATIQVPFISSDSKPLNIGQ